MLPWQHLLPDIKLINSNVCMGMERKEPTKIFVYKSKKQRKNVAMATLVARYCQKNYQLQSLQWYGMQRTHKNIYKSKKQKKVFLWQHLLQRQNLWPSIIEKLISSNPCRGLECKEPPKKIFKPKKLKSVAMAILVTGYCRKANQPQFPF